jgi:hypothetical protein
MVAGAVFTPAGAVTAAEDSAVARRHPRSLGTRVATPAHRLPDMRDLVGTLLALSAAQQARE